MGSDNAPESELDAVAELAEGTGEPIAITLVGDEPQLRAGLARRKVQPTNKLSVWHTTQVVRMEDSPTSAARAKRDSSMRVCFDLVRSGSADAVVSAGNSGAMLACGLLVFRRLPGALRPALIAGLPTLGPHEVILCDAGANVEVKPHVLAQFGVLGAAYAQVTSGRSRPRLGLLANGAEEGKGTELTRAAHALLRQLEQRGAPFQFMGYVEGRDLFSGALDVVATDGFTGNVVLKTAEGVAEATLTFMREALRSSPRAALGAILAAPALAAVKQRVAYHERGGAPLLGIDGLALVCHGSSDGRALANGVRAAARHADLGLTARVADALARARVADPGEGDAPAAELPGQEGTG